MSSYRKEARKVISRGHFLRGLENHMRSLDFALRASGVLLRIYSFEFAYIGCTVAVVGGRTEAG